MKNFLKITLFTILALFLIAGNSNSLTITYNDIYANWPGWPINPNDEIGIPRIQNIEGVTVTISDSGYLSSVGIIMEGRPFWKNTHYESLFINNDWNGTYGDYQSWDFYVKDFPMLGVDASAKLYSVDGYSYLLATQEDSLTGRWGHPAGIGSGLIEVSGLQSVVWVSGTPGTLTYTFDGTPNAPRIYMYENFVIGYSLWCANDVFLTPIPEPTTLLLLGAGLIGIAFLGRRRLRGFKI